jgi:hypothetical protein
MLITDDWKQSATLENSTELNNSLTVKVLLESRKRKKPPVTWKEGFIDDKSRTTYVNSLITFHQNICGSRRNK